MSSSSCGSIEREADNQENLDELTLEEQAMTYGLCETQPTELPIKIAVKEPTNAKMEYQEIDKAAERLPSDSSKVASGLFTTSAPRSKNSEDDVASGHKATKLVLGSQNSCYQRQKNSKF